MRDDFFVVLRSGKSNDYFPTNTTAHFTTYLPQEVKLQDNWSVALLEANVPMTFFHVPKDNKRNVIRDLKIFQIPDPKPTADKGGTIDLKERTDYHLPSGIYYKIEDVVLALNSIKSLSSHLRFAYHEDGGYVSVTTICQKTCSKHVITLSPEIAKIMGYSTRTLNLYNPCSLKGDAPADVTSLLPKQIFVYTDICEPYITGDVQSRLLGIIPIDTSNYRYGCVQMHSVITPRFLPVMTSSFRTIEMDLRDESGRPVSFEDGECNLTLQFQKNY